MTTAQTIVLDVLKRHGPLPDHALVPIVQHVAQTHMSSSGIRTRRRELERLREVKSVGEVKMPSGRRANVWDVA